MDPHNLDNTVSGFLEQCQSHIAVMGPHQRERKTGQLLIEAARIIGQLRPVLWPTMDQTKYDEAVAREWPERPKTPTLDAMFALKPKIQPVLDFLEWLEKEQMIICKLEGTGDSRINYPIRESAQEIVARYHNLDAAKVNSEQRTVLEYDLFQGGHA